MFYQHLNIFSWFLEVGVYMRLLKIRKKKYLAKNKHKTPSLLLFLSRYLYVIRGGNSLLPRIFTLMISN